MTERQVFLAECYLSKKEDGTEIYSTYEKCKVIFLHIKDVLYLSWSLFINLSDENIFVICQIKKYWSNNQNNEFHIAILPGLLV